MGRKRCYATLILGLLITTSAWAAFKTDNLTVTNVGIFNGTGEPAIECSGNVSANFYIGNGSLLTGIALANGSDIITGNISVNGIGPVTAYWYGANGYYTGISATNFSANSIYSLPIVSADGFLKNTIGQWSWDNSVINSAGLATLLSPINSTSTIGALNFTIWGADSISAITWFDSNGVNWTKIQGADFAGNNTYTWPIVSATGFLQNIGGVLIWNNTTSVDLSNYTGNINTTGSIGASNFTIWGDGVANFTFFDSNGINWTKITGASFDGNHTYALPISKANGLLKNTNGVLTWDTSSGAGVDGSALINLNGANISSGTIPEARLVNSSNWSLAYGWGNHATASYALQSNLTGFTGSSNIVTLGTIATGVWNGTTIKDAYIASAATWNAKLATTGAGVALTSLNASNLSEGTIPLARIPANTTNDQNLNTTSNVTFVNVTATRFFTNTNQIGYTLQGGHTLLAAPANSTTYYWGQPNLAASTTGATARRIYFPRPGTISKIYVTYAVGTNATSENTTIQFDINNSGSPTVISNTVNFNSSYPTAINTSLSTAVIAGNYIEFQLVTPAWATKAQNIAGNAVIWVDE